MLTLLFSAFTLYLKQILSIEHCRLQREGIHAFHAAEVHDVLSRPARRLAESVDAAVLAEIVFRLFPVPLVKIQRAFLRVDLELRPRHEMHHHSPPGTERTVAAHTMGKRLGLERELDRTAVATGLVGLHGHLVN